MFLQEWSRTWLVASVVDVIDFFNPCITFFDLYLFYFWNMLYKNCTNLKLFEVSKNSNPQIFKNLFSLEHYISRINIVKWCFEIPTIIYIYHIYIYLIFIIQKNLIIVLIWSTKFTSEKKTKIRTNCVLNGKIFEKNTRA